MLLIKITKVRVKLVEYVDCSAFHCLLSLWVQEYVLFMHLASISIAFLVYLDDNIHIKHRWNLGVFYLGGLKRQGSDTSLCYLFPQTEEIHGRLEKPAPLLFFISLLNSWISYENTANNSHYQVSKAQYFPFRHYSMHKLALTDKFGEIKYRQGQVHSTMKRQNLPILGILALSLTEERWGSQNWKWIWRMDGVLAWKAAVYIGTDTMGVRTCWKPHLSAMALVTAQAVP